MPTYLTMSSDTERTCPGSLAKQHVSFLRVTVLKGQQIRIIIDGPVEASNSNVLEKDEVQRELRDGKYQARLLAKDEYLLNFTTCEAHNDCPSLPGNALE